MDIIKKIFPFSFIEKKDVIALVINCVLYFVASIVIGAVIGLFGTIPVLGVIFSIIGGLVGLYALCGIVLSILDYLKVLKI
ncbi:MAG: hypothetical protein IKU23_00665 [Clostridia bacterium]|nr:hypothetical protein [Clostridia bacterium]